MGSARYGLGIGLIILAGLAFGQAGHVARLANGRMSIGFDRNVGGLVALSAPDQAAPFVRGTAAPPFLWELHFRSGDGGEWRIDNAQVSEPQITQTGESMTLEWKNLAVKDELGALDVKAVCELQADEALLRLWVDNRSAQWGLWEVSFPVFRAMGEAGATDVAMGRGTWGQLFRQPTEPLRGEYPSASLPMQFILLQDGAYGLCLAAHDPEAWHKVFTIQTGAEFRVTTRVPGMGVAGSDWAAPYPFSLSLYEGSWMRGCKIYRAWVTANAPWTRKGPLVSRKDVPAHIKNVCAWLLGSGGPDDVAPSVRRFADAIGAPAGVHWYNWHEIPFDTFYPNYFPTKAGYAEAVKELVASGVTVMPYINARLWDTANENFGEARPASAKNEKNEVIIEEYGSGAKLAVMCPTTALWQGKVEEIIHRLGEECGVNAVYLDQIASAPPRVCFDAGHGHPLGSGAWWVDGYRELLTPIKQWVTADGRAIGLTTENNAEPYMDNIDAHLIWTPRSDDEIPMGAAVYSGYTLFFASNRAFAHGDTSYCLCQARDFVWGTQLGWDGAEILAPEHAEKLRFLSRLARLRAKALYYFVYGELVEVVEPLNDIPILSGTWNKPGGDGPVALRAVHAARWLGNDGSTAIAFANADTKPHGFSFAWQNAAGNAGRDVKWKVERLTPDGREDLDVREGAAFTYSVDIPSRDGVILIFRKTAEQ